MPVEVPRSGSQDATHCDTGKYWQILATLAMKQAKAFILCATRSVSYKLVVRRMQLATVSNPTRDPKLQEAPNRGKPEGVVEFTNA